MQSQVNPYGQPSQLQDDIDNPNDERQNIFRVKTPVQRLQLIPKNSLDQGQCDSLCSEFGSMCYKFSYVLIPRSDQNSNKLRNWDLWGPFFMCLIYGIFISNSSDFLFLFFAVFAGAIIVSFNVKVLGGDISFFQSVAILGYCILPVFLAMLITKLLTFVQVKEQIINVILIVVAILWSILSSRAFIAVNVPDNRKCVAVFPISLFYILIGVMLIYS